MLEANIGDKPYERSCKQISAGLVKAYGSGWWLRNPHNLVEKAAENSCVLNLSKILVTSKGFNDERLNDLRFRIK